MLSKSQLKYIQSLHHKKFRQMYGYFLVEGRKSVHDLLQSDFEINTIYATNEWFATNLLDKRFETVLVSETELQKIATHQQPDQVIAVVKMPAFELPAPLPAGKYIFLDQLNDPGNAGTIIRTADWFGWDGVVFSEDSVELFNPKVINAAKGSLFHIKIYQTALKPLLENSQTHTIYGALMEGESIYKATKDPNAILLIGNEANGIQDLHLPFLNKHITIPRTGKAESLNAGVAAAILMNEWGRI